MRGALDDKVADLEAQRIIPADAGSTIPGYRRLGILGDHPRGCGEHFRWSGQITCPLGSSPRMRGARSAFFIQTKQGRIIPADAGSTLIRVIQEFV